MALDGFKPEVQVLDSAGVIIDPATKTAQTDGSQKVQISGPLTAFGDLRNAELSPIFQINFDYTVDNTEITTNTVVNGGTVTQANSMAVVSSSATTGSTALLVSKTSAKYKSGLGALSRFTTLFETAVAGTHQYMGLADEVGSSVSFKNGYMIGYNGTTFGFHRFQNDTQISVAQSSFDDPLDGTGASGITLDQTKLNAWEIRFQYLGSGSMELWLASEYTGKFVLVNTVQYTNQNTEPSVYNTNFKFSIYVDNGATTSDIVLKSASISYFIEGKSPFLINRQPKHSTGTVEKTTVTTSIALLTIRNKSIYASKTNFIDCLIESISISEEASSANNLAQFRLVKNATLGGTPSYTDIDTSDSVLDLDTAGTTVTGGVELLSAQLAGKNDRFFEKLVELELILFPGDTVTLSVLSANSATFRGSLLLKELF